MTKLKNMGESGFLKLVFALFTLAFLVAAVVMPDRGTMLERAGRFAVGQTIGTWVPVPGISQEMIDRYQGQVLGVYETGETADGAALSQAFEQAVQNLSRRLYRQMDEKTQKAVSNGL